MVQNRLKFYLDRINDIIYDVDRNFIVNYVNASDHRHRGFMPSEVIGKNFLNILYNEDVTRFTSEINDLVDQSRRDPGLFSKNIRIRLLKKDDTWFWADVSLNVTFFHNEFAGFIAVCRDVSSEVENYHKLYESQEKLQEIIRQKDTLFSVIAHDLRTPIHNFIYFTDYFFEKFDELDNQSRTKLKTQLSHSAKKLNELLDELLTWSRFQRGLIVPSFQKHNIHNVIDQAIETLAPIAQAKNIKIFVDDSCNIDLECDLNMAKTILRNLISNAIKFSFRGTKIDIYAEKNESNAYIYVQDYGKGINPSILPKLFELGSKIGTLGTEGEPSTGMGLTICKQFIDAHKGSIEVTSKPNEGSTFKISLPLKQN